jgi:hypothetical protein
MDKNIEYVDNPFIFLVEKGFTSSCGKNITKGQHLKCIAYYIKGSDTFLITLDETGKEATCLIERVMDNCHECMEPCRHDIEVGDYVAILKDGRKFTGSVLEEKENEYIVSINGISSFAKIEEATVDKSMVANFQDCCTIVCDYRKDPKNPTMRFEYSMDYIRTHKRMEHWDHQGDIFVKEQ